VESAINKQIPKIKEIVDQKIEVAKANFVDMACGRVNADLADFKADLRDSIKRQTNILIHDEGESESKDLQQTILEDYNKVSTFLKNIGLNPTVLGKLTKTSNDITITNHFRLGPPREKDATPRAILVTLGSINEVDKIMKQARINTTKGTRCKVTRDYTKLEREQFKKLKEELNTRTDDGEKDLVIKNGKITKKQPFRGTHRPDTEVHK
jgi:mRNA-degrading endonuclease RelE of RelBE toxin-antitoxin system